MTAVAGMHEALQQASLLAQRCGAAIKCRVSHTACAFLVGQCRVKA